MAEDLTPLSRPRHPGDVTLHRKRLPRHHQRRVLGVPALFASAYGQLGAPVYYVLGLVALHALALTPLAFVVSGALFVLTAITYTEMATALPDGGGASAFAHRAFNDLVSFVAGWALCLAYVAGIAISAWAAVHYLGALLPFVAWPDVQRALTILVIIGVAVANLLAAHEPARLHIITAALNLGTQAVVITAGLVFLFDMDTLLHNVRLGATTTWSPFLVAVALSMIAYTGIEAVSGLSAEARAPGRVIPRALLFVALVVLAVYVPVSLVALTAMPMYALPGGGWASDLLGAWQTHSLAGIVNALPGVLRFVLRLWVPLLATLALVVAANAHFHSLTHLAHTMGQRRQLPALLSRVTGRFRSPVGVVTLAALVAIALVAPGRVHLLADVLAFAVLSVFALAHASALALRRREPDLARPYRAPLNIRIGGRAFPLTAMAGLALTLLLWVIVLWLRPEGRWLGLGWLAVGALIYGAYRLARRLPLVAAAPPAAADGDTAAS